MLFVKRLIPVFFLFLLSACSNQCEEQIIEIKLSAPDRNSLRVNADVELKQPLDVSIEYWIKGKEKQPSRTPVSTNKKHHRIVMTNLKPKQQYQYRVITKTSNCEAISKTYDFKTSDFPMWIQDFFKVYAPDPKVIPTTFKEGYMLIYRREIPGIIFIIDAKGAIRWYHQVDGTGFKTTHFTQNKTFLSILGNDEYPTSYGNEILEVSLNGDTLLHLKKGEKDFKQTIHHEIILNKQNQVVTLCVEQKVMDLSKYGGTRQDTVKSDGILVLDRNGKKVWSWKVFDELDPLKDKNLMRDKKDWMHANSLSFDKDGNYLISFYNNGQIWKLDAKTGKVIWKFGKDGDFKMPLGSTFDQGHSVHMNNQGNLMLFDNGTSKKLSRTLVFKLNESDKTSQLVTETKLPQEIYNDRMGSSYLVADTTILQCTSKRHTVVLTNFKGTFLWMLKSSIMPYRVEFIPKEKLAPYIEN
jgi:hypothetical protein